MDFELIPPIPRLYRLLSINEWINYTPSYTTYKIGHILQYMFKQLLDFYHTHHLKISCKEDLLWNDFVNFVYNNRYKSINMK